MTPKWQTKTQLERRFEKFSIPKNQRFVMDSVSYYDTIQKITKQNLEKAQLDDSNIDSAQIIQNNNDNLQAVQVRYFNQDGSPFFRLLNCNIKGGSKMTWNMQGEFDVFPPKTNVEKVKQDIRDLSFFLTHIKTLNNESVTFKNLPKADYYALVFWNSMLMKHSKTLIKDLKKYEEENQDSSVFTLYVNNHNSWVGLMTDNREKEMNSIEIN